MTDNENIEFHVPAFTSQIPVHVFDMTDKNNPVKLQAGVVTTTHYKGENVKRLAYETVDNKEYRMGTTTEKFQFVDHTTAIEPFLSAGYKLKQFFTFKGGLQMQATLTAPADVVPVEDPINWDLEFWKERLSQGSVDHNLHHSITITSGIKPGKAINIDSGWYRLVCTNGMMSKILGLPGTRMNHSNFSVDVLEQKYLSAPALNALTAPKEHALMGPFVGNQKGADKLAGLLRKLGAEIGSLNDEDGEDDGDEEAKLSPKALRKAKASQELPYYLNELVTPFTRQPLWFLRSAADQLEAMASQNDRTKFYGLDMVNAMTNPVNLYREDRPISARPVLQQNSLTEAASKLVGAFSL